MSENGNRPELPQGWGWKPLGEIAKTSSGGTPRRARPEYYANGTIPWLKIGDLNDSIVETTEERITPLGLQKSSTEMLPAGTLLMAMYGSIGKLGILGTDAATNQAICAIRPDEAFVSRDYLFWFLLSRRSVLRGAGFGGTQANISQGFLRTFLIAVPPRHEQAAIARWVEQQLTKLDAGLGSLTAGTRALSGFRRSTLARAFSRSHPQNLTLGQLCDRVGGRIQTGPFGSQLHASDYQDSGTPVVMPRNLDYGVISTRNIARVGDRHVTRLSRHAVQVGDILQSRRGDLRRRALVTKAQEGWLCGTGCFVIRFGDEELARFVIEHLAEPNTASFLEKEAVGVTMPNLNAKILKAIPLSIPEPEGRAEILADIHEQADRADHLEVSVATVRNRVEELKRAVLARAFTRRLHERNLIS